MGRWVEKRLNATPEASERLWEFVGKDWAGTPGVGRHQQHLDQGDREVGGQGGSWERKFLDRVITNALRIGIAGLNVHQWSMACHNR